ncbi:SUMF1/EgtB/PvdO family nonheme iron enzyme [Persicirhabdus sediminis]|uniref:SUMF1/EgtB/PvdO family nonheme iron enzyme n=1 Tax=Persicirhabdus sediminis TaxID=454144 RepID=A0A8J7MDV6_9BACT|nr:SUMF1/EgtB/PvdO family nonheme iron enzyme [Persicirhabdus sediminis]MBK1792039.1 SUMF1/EgtB/PvdO family nonheme iron enzyme [Persicirhabdus sediminis]
MMKYSLVSMCGAMLGAVASVSASPQSSALYESPVILAEDGLFSWQAKVTPSKAVFLEVYSVGKTSKNDQAVWTELSWQDAAGKSTTLNSSDLKVLITPEGQESKWQDKLSFAPKGAMLTPARTVMRWIAPAEAVSLSGLSGLNPETGKDGAVHFRILSSKPADPPKAVDSKVPFEERRNAFSVGQQITSLKLAIDDLAQTFPNEYEAKGFLAKLAKVEAISDLQEKNKQLQELKREALFANPALDFDDILFVRRNLGGAARSAMGQRLGFTRNNAFSMHSAYRDSKGNEIMKLKNFKSKPELETVYKPNKDILVSDIDLDFDGKRVLYTSVNEESSFRLYELDLATGKTRQVTTNEEGADVDHFDACYLPDGDIIFTSTATFLGMPCINGGPRMASLFRYSPKTGKTRQLSFDQDSSWCPTVLNDGRVIYLRWEYSDMVHSNNRVLMSMNPDGSNQRSFMFSNSYFPASFFYATPVPGSSSKVVGIATGHHGFSRTGRMLLVDRTLGEHEADGVIQEIPGRGIKVEPEVKDRQGDGMWPQNVHPHPVAQSGTDLGAGKYFLTAMKPNADSLWGIYLVDTFDNQILLHETEGLASFEPVALKSRERPKMRPSRIVEGAEDASVFIQDVYQGPGLAGLPKGEVKSLRVVTYEFAPSSSDPKKLNYSAGSGGNVGTLGADGPWDIKRVLGTVPVYEDGSAHFNIPAMTPVFLQPLDEDGQALQLMRTWMVGQPGERVSCIGCHESAADTPVPQRTLASLKEPNEIKPWNGRGHNFDYDTEIQPIVDQHCMACHDGKPADGRYETLRADYKGKPIPYLGSDMIEDWSTRFGGQLKPQNGGGAFSKGYFEMFKMSRGPGIESDMHVLTPKEFSANTTELVQMLKKGHHGVELDQDEWSRLYEWMDMNTPYHGVRLRIVEGLRAEAAVKRAMVRSKEMIEHHGLKRDHFVSADQDVKVEKIEPIKPDNSAEIAQRAKGKMEFAAKISDDSKEPITLDLGDGMSIKLVYIPAGEFVMGSADGALDELPMHKQKVDKGFWMAEMEISNEQLRKFNPDHHSRHEHRVGYQFGETGFDVNDDPRAAVRVSWDEAMAFCKWLSEKTGKKVTLPSEVQWEWASRAGTSTPFSFGEYGSDFSKFANLADKATEQYATDTSTKGEFKYFGVITLEDPTKYEAYIPADKSVDDGYFLHNEGGKYKANPWGLYDMHGNVAEWTRSIYQPYPLQDGHATEQVGSDMVVRGGSWRDRPHRSTSSYRLAYPSFQQVFNVGFRVIVEE